MQKFARGADGSHSPAGTFATGGAGLAFDESGRYLMAVSPGNATSPAQAVSYRDGSLTLAGSAPAAAGLTGAAAR